MLLFIRADHLFAVIGSKLLLQGHDNKEVPNKVCITNLAVPVKICLNIYFTIIKLKLFKNNTNELLTFTEF